MLIQLTLNHLYFLNIGILTHLSKIMNHDFPNAKVPLAPLLGDHNNAPTYTTSSVLDLKNICFTTSGRAAITLALKHANIQAGDEVLIPAYHCEAMVAPAKWLKAKVIFYRIHRNTSANFEDIVKKLTPNTKAIIVTHYFGFLQNLEQLREFSDQNNLILIEDCAHAFFGENRQHAVGKIGDYCIASSMKFLPLYEGGILCSEKNNLDDLKLNSPALNFQLKSLINILEKSIKYNRLSSLGKVFNSLFYIKNLLWSTLKKLKGQQSTQIGPGSSEGGYGLDSEWVYKTCSQTSKWIINHTDLNSTAYQRRINYQKIHQSLSSLPNCNPLFSELPEQIIPFVYPLYVNNPEYYFKKLKMLGIPIWRFGEFLDSEVTEQIFPISVEYSQHIFQFPCHQSMTEQELDWMLDTISQTLKVNE